MQTLEGTDVGFAGPLARFECTVMFWSRKDPQARWVFIAVQHIWGPTKTGKQRFPVPLTFFPHCYQLKS